MLIYIYGIFILIYINNIYIYTHNLYINFIPDLPDKGLYIYQNYLPPSYSFLLLLLSQLRALDFNGHCRISTPRNLDFSEYYRTLAANSRSQRHYQALIASVLIESWSLRLRSDIPIWWKKKNKNKYILFIYYFYFLNIFRIIRFDWNLILIIIIIIINIFK